MIHEQTVWKCVCLKCKGEWITKSYEIPANCAKCRSLKWNDDYIDMSTGEILEKTQVAVKQDDALAAFIAKAQAAKGIVQTIDAPIETVDEWAGWSEPRQTRDDEAGEIVHYRQHIKTGKRSILSRETAW